jgi:hypothetical protein
MIAMCFLAAAAGFLGGGLHARIAEALATRNDIDPLVALMLPQFVGWFILALGLVAWPIAKNRNKNITLILAAAAIVGALICSVLYVPVSQAIFFDDPFEYALPGHIYSFRFWYLFGGVALSLSIGNACSHQIAVPEPETESE